MYVFEVSPGLILPTTVAFAVRTLHRIADTQGGGPDAAGERVLIYDGGVSRDVAPDCEWSLQAR